VIVNDVRATTCGVLNFDGSERKDEM